MRKDLVIEKKEKKHPKLFHITPANAEFIDDFSAKKQVSKSALLNAIIDFFRKNK